MKFIVRSNLQHNNYYFDIEIITTSGFSVLESIAQCFPDREIKNDIADVSNAFLKIDEIYIVIDEHNVYMHIYDYDKDVETLVIEGLTRQFVTEISYQFATLFAYYAKKQYDLEFIRKQ
jgi:hypothetical protein